ncbi:MAG: hemerythrin domain-containing protein [Thermoanaerobaculia bacterium]
MARGTRGGNGRKGGNGESESEKEERGGLLSKIGSVFSSGSEEQESRGMKATEMLREDHDRVRALFKEYEAAGEGAYETKKRILQQLSMELDIHAKLEEEIFYQAFRTAQEEQPKKVVRESFEEHKIVKTLLGELAEMRPQDDQYDAKVTVLQEGVEHHADEEERELFPATEDLFGDEGLERLGAEMEDRKEELMRELEGASRGGSRAGSRSGRASGRSSGSRTSSSSRRRPRGRTGAEV